jgi:hypothetical protein
MKKVFAFLLVMGTGVIAMAQPPKVPADAGTSFGEKTTQEDAISVEQMVSILNGKKEGAKKMDVKLKAEVTDVCTAEGCWIKVKSTDGKLMVKMKDHKFLVPLALNGKNIVIQGTAEEKITSVEMLRHYAEDAGKSKEEIAAIKEPKKEIVVQAKGILVL